MIVSVKLVVAHVEDEDCISHRCRGGNVLVGVILLVVAVARVGQDQSRYGMCAGASRVWDAHGSQTWRGCVGMGCAREPGAAARVWQDRGSTVHELQWGRKGTAAPLVSGREVSEWMEGK